MSYNNQSFNANASRLGAKISDLHLSLKENVQFNGEANAETLTKAFVLTTSTLATCRVRNTKASVEAPTLYTNLLERQLNSMIITESPEATAHQKLEYLIRDAYAAIDIEDRSDVSIEDEDLVAGLKALMEHSKTLDVNVIENSQNSSGILNKKNLFKVLTIVFLACQLFEIISPITRNLNSLEGLLFAFFILACSVPVISALALCCAIKRVALA